MACIFDQRKTHRFEYNEKGRISRFLKRFTPIRDQTKRKWFDFAKITLTAVELRRLQLDSFRLERLRVGSEFITIELRLRLDSVSTEQVAVILDCSCGWTPNSLTVELRLFDAQFDLAVGV